MPNARKSWRQDVDQETTNKLIHGDSHLLWPIVVLVITPLKGDMTVFQFHNARVGDSHAMGVSSQILDDIPRILEGGLAVHDPFLLVQGSEQPLEKRWMLQVCCGTEELKLGVLEIGQELASELSGEHLHRNKELLLGRDPLALCIQTSPGNHHMQMRMVHEILSPGMEDRGKANLCAQILVVNRQLG